MGVEVLVVEDPCRSGRSEPYKSNEVRIFVCIPIVELALSRAKTRMEGCAEHSSGGNKFNYFQIIKSRRATGNGPECAT